MTTVDTYDELRVLLDKMSDGIEEWQGLPIPLNDLPLVLNDRHPLADVYKGFDKDALKRSGDVLIDVFDDVKVRNSWYCAQKNSDVYIYEEDGKIRHLRAPRSPDMSMDRLKFWLNTIGASDAWDLEAEYRARKLLKSMLSERQWRHYELTGSFLETSPRSKVTYVFRRLRPTIALTPRHKFDRQFDSVRVLAVLCLHSIGYYAESWGGTLVPTDDVMSHLLFLRGDEAGFWGVANQHEAWTPQAGL